MKRTANDLAEKVERAARADHTSQVDHFTREAEARVNGIAKEAADRLKLLREVGYEKMARGDTSDDFGKSMPPMS